MSKASPIAVPPSLAAALVEPRHIQLQLTARTPEDAISELAALLESHPAVVDHKELERSVLERERVASTALGHGVALPHARTSAVRDFALTIGRSTDGIVFPGAEEPTRLVFLLAAPVGRVGDHLSIVARLSRALARAATRSALLAAETADEFARVLAAAL